MTGRRLTHPGEKKPQRAILKEKSRQLPPGVVADGSKND